MNKQQSIPTSIIIGVIALIVIIIGGLGYAISQNDDDSDNDDSMSEVSQDANQTSMLASEDEMADMTLDLSAVVGTYTGTGSLLTSSLIFPETTFELNPSGTVQLTASGLSLAALNNPALQVEGQYPVVTITAFGSAIPESDGTVMMSITELTPVFTISQQPIPVSASLAIAAGLEASGIVIPTATESEPLMIPTTVMANTDGSISIENTEDSLIAISFDGSVQ